MCNRYMYSSGAKQSDTLDARRINSTFYYFTKVFPIQSNIYVLKQYIFSSGGPLSALTCCVNVRLLSGDKKNIAVNLFSKLGWELGLYYASYDDFHPDILARMYT